MRYAQLHQATQYIVGYVGHFAATVLLNRAVTYALTVHVAKQPWQQLIYDGLIQE